MKRVYPFLIRLVKSKTASGDILRNESMLSPVTSIYDISFDSINGSVISFNQYRGKKILIVNTASDCGFTPQYESLESIYKKHSDSLVIIGFPANDFKQQEKKSNDEIAAFCKINYGVSFPLSQKISVIKGKEQHELYQWLTQPEKNGWNSKQPSWNFSKYLIDENGVLLSFMAPAVDPETEAFKNAVGI